MRNRPKGQTKRCPRPLRVLALAKEVPRQCYDRWPRPKAPRPTLEAMRVAILEDDPDQLALLRRWVVAAGHDVHGYLCGREAIRDAARESYDLWVLDWQVPDVSGLDVLDWIRANVSQRVPVLFVTVRDAEEDVVRALERGADDYVVKPPRRAELLARMAALLRRAYPQDDEAVLSFPPYQFDVRKRTLTCDGRPVELTPKEYELALTLFRNLGRLLSRGHLHEAVWGRFGETQSRTVDTHVSQLRKKLGLTARSGYRIVPVYNYGYRLERAD